MEPAERNDLIGAWRRLAAVLTYPATIVPGISSVVLIVSGVCVPLDCWSLEGAMSNLFLGLLAIAGVAALWVTTLCPHPALARNPYRFVLVTTGLVMGLVLNTLILKAKLQSDLTPVFAADLLEAWMYAGPLLAGSINLALLIYARSRMNEELALEPARVSGVPRPHLRLDEALTPVTLRPYRPPVTVRSDRRVRHLP